jgi:hypothetical protein
MTDTSAVHAVESEPQFMSREAFVRRGYQPETYESCRAKFDEESGRAKKEDPASVEFRKAQIKRDADANDERVVAAREAVRLVTSWVPARESAVREANVQIVQAELAVKRAESEFAKQGEPAWPALKLARDECEKRLAILERARAQLEQTLETLRREQDAAAVTERHVRLERVTREREKLVADTVPLLRQLVAHLRTAHSQQDEGDGGPLSVSAFLEKLNDQLWEGTRREGIRAIVLRTIEGN